MPASIASVGMSSTAVRQRANHSRSSGLHGASAKPQLPMMTLVTPCQQEQLPIRSHATWASMWVWPSMKPGATISPSASMVRSAADADAPDLDDAAVLDADVAAIARGARAVDDRPVADHQIEPHAVLPRGSRAMSGRRGRMIALWYAIPRAIGRPARSDAAGREPAALRTAR